MIPVLATAWRVILMRARSDWLILAAALLVIVLATTLLSAGPIYAGAVAESGLHRTLHDAPATEVNVEITARITGAEFLPMDDIVIQQSSNAFRFSGASVQRSGRSDSFALPDQPGEIVTDLGVFAFFDDVQLHATLVEGAWPSGESGDVLASAIPESTAELLSLSIGDELVLESRRQDGFLIATRVEGIYRVDDASDPYWWDDELDLNGIVEGQSFVTYGPFVVSPADFYNQVTVSTSLTRWRVYPVWTTLSVGDVAAFRGAVEQLEGRLNSELRSADRFTVNTTLPRILRAAERSLLVTRTGVVILTLQLAILAGYALVLTAGLLTEQRRVETALLRSRGGGSGQIGVMAFMEGLLLAAPAAMLGPWIAALSLRLLNVVGPLTTIDLAVEPVVTGLAYALSAVSALACVMALTLPAYRSARSFVDARSARGRQQTRGGAQRAGADLALLAIAGLGYWQLRRYGAPITETVQGRLGLDPFLVAAPAIGLLAGAVVALRVIPLLARTIDRLVTTTRGLVPSLGAWQVSRRPTRYARAALLLVLAMAIGLFAVSYTSTWTASQADQADFQTGADVRIVPDRRVSTAITPLNLADAHQHIDGVTETMPVTRDVLTVSRSAGAGRLLGIDAAAANVVAFRPDLAMDDFDAMMQRLVDSRPTLPVVPLPGEPRRLALHVDLAFDPVSDGAPPDWLESLSPRITVVFQDQRGLLHSRLSARIEPGAWDGRVEIPLVFELGNGEVATPEFPLTIAAIDFRVLIPQDQPITGRFAIDRIEVSDSVIGDDWTSVATGDAGNWSFSLTAVGGLLEAPELAPATDDRSGRVAATFSTGAHRGNTRVPVDFHLRAGASPAFESVAVVVSDLFLQSTETSVGDRIPLDIGGGPQVVEIVGSVVAFPTIEERSGGIIIIDLPTLAMMRFSRDARVISPGEWWLNVDEAARAEAVSTLWQEPYSSSRVFDRVDRAVTLRTDPVALGIIGALSLGFVASGLFAAIGFVVSASVSARERITEFALLRALGLSPRQLSGWLSLENGLLVGVSLVGGTLLGLTLAWLVLPFVTLTQDASAVMPGVIVQIPWRTILMLELVTVVALAGVVAVSAVLLRRIGLGSVLRLGEE
ncbi:MAG TPA: ABC transporter permease [Thermomicrobiales bacterium]|nr:ABC transporter permease [Thermomicrobiales bacterium]